MRGNYLARPVSSDELEAWLGMPATQVFFQEIAAMAEEARDHALVCVAGEEFHKAGQAGGYMQALQDVLAMPDDWADGTDG